MTHAVQIPNAPSPMWIPRSFRQYNPGPARSRASIVRNVYAMRGDVADSKP